MAVMTGRVRRRSRSWGWAWGIRSGAKAAGVKSASSFFSIPATGGRGRWARCRKSGLLLRRRLGLGFLEIDALRRGWVRWRKNGSGVPAQTPLNLRTERIEENLLGSLALSLGVAVHATAALSLF